MIGPETLTGDEAVALLGQLLSVGSGGAGRVRCVRNWGMGMVMLEAGLRVGELVGLNVGDLALRGEPVRMLIVRSEIAKRSKERQIPVSTRLHGAIAELIRVLWRGNTELAWVPCWFCGIKARRLTTRQVESIVRAAGVAALGRPIHPHVLRHTFGTRMERVAGIRVAQALLGHADIRTTQIYCHPNGEDLQRAVDGLGRLAGGGT
jgi:integrase/recombinase XerC